MPAGDGVWRVWRVLEGLEGGKNLAGKCLGGHFKWAVARLCPGLVLQLRCSASFFLYFTKNIHQFSY